MSDCKHSAFFFATCVAAAVFCGASYADGTGGAEGNFYSFEGIVEGTTLDSAALSGLTGEGVISNASAVSSVGYPLPDEATHAQSLAISDTVAYTNGTEFVNSAMASQVDMLFCVKRGYGLRNLSEAGVQAALAIGSSSSDGLTAPVMLWCKSNNTENCWVQLWSSATVGSWLRATLEFDYDFNQCRVSLNGMIADAAGSISNGWFALAGTPAQSYVKVVEMASATGAMVDEFAVTNSVASEFNPDYGSGTVPVGTGPTDVPLEYLRTYGVPIQAATDNAILNADSGMTLEEKYVAGLDPNSSTRFKMLDMRLPATDKVEVKFAGNHDSGYKIVWSDNKTGSFDNDATALSLKDTGARTEAGEKIQTITGTIGQSGAKWVELQATK